MNLLFDLDGTLIDPFEGITRSFQYALEKLNRPVPTQQTLSQYIGPPLRQGLATALNSDDAALIDDAIILFREYLGATGLFQNSLYEGIVAQLDQLKGDGHKLFVATSKPHFYAEQIIAQHTLTQFESVYGPEMDGTRENKPDLIRYLLTQENIAASESIMFGDRKHDIIGAHANQLIGVGVTWGYGSVEELQAADCQALCTNPAELSDLVAALSKE